MRHADATGQRLAAIFMMGCVLLNPPIASLFDRAVDLGGVPLHYAYVFFAWGLVIALMAWVIERPRD
jgi:hypothetical protein